MSTDSLSRLQRGLAELLGRIPLSPGARETLRCVGNARENVVMLALIFALQTSSPKG